MQIKNSKQAKLGFTLIELMLAVAFLGTLLLSIAMLAMCLVDMYTKGSTMRAVNSTGSAIMDDMRSQITSSNPWTSNLGDGLTAIKAKEDQRQYYRYHTYTVDKKTETEEVFPDYGAFCTNSYTYVFNYQPAMLRYREDLKNGADLNSGNYLMVGEDEPTRRPYGLVRIKDPGCAQFSRLNMTKEEIDAYNKTLEDHSNDLEENSDSGSIWSDKPENRFLKVDKNDMVVLLDGSRSDENSDLQLYDFTVMAAVQNKTTHQVLYDIAFVLGTSRGGINVHSSNNYCKKKTKALSGMDYAEEYDNNTISYCSVNRFEFVVRQTGGKE